MNQLFDARDMFDIAAIAEFTSYLPYVLIP